MVRASCARTVWGPVSSLQSVAHCSNLCMCSFVCSQYRFCFVRMWSRASLLRLRSLWSELLRLNLAISFSGARAFWSLCGGCDFFDLLGECSQACILILAFLRRSLSHFSAEVSPSKTFKRMCGVSLAVAGLFCLLQCIHF